MQCKSKVEPEAKLPGHLERALVLCFHDIYQPDGSRSMKGRRGRYAIPQSDFREILEALAQYRVTSLADWVHRKNSEDIRPRVVLTFDDGYKSHREIVLPELRQRGYGATFFFYADQLKADKKWVSLARIADPAFEYGSHSWSHALLRDVSYDEIFRELYLAREFMVHTLSQQAPAFAWPYGYYDPIGVAAAKSAGFSYQVSVDYRVATRADIGQVIPRYTIFGRQAVGQVKQILQKYAAKEPVPSD